MDYTMDLTAVFALKEISCLAISLPSSYCLAYS